MSPFSPNFQLTRHFINEQDVIYIGGKLPPINRNNLLTYYNYFSY